MYLFRNSQIMTVVSFRGLVSSVVVTTDRMNPQESTATSLFPTIRYNICYISIRVRASLSDPTATDQIS